MLLFWISITWIFALFSLYSIFRGVEYKATIKILDKENESLRVANKNLTQIIREEDEKKMAFEVNCG